MDGLIVSMCMGVYVLQCTHGGQKATCMSLSSSSTTGDWGLNLGLGLVAWTFIHEAISLGPSYSHKTLSFYLSLSGTLLTHVHASSNSAILHQHIFPAR